MARSRRHSSDLVLRLAIAVASLITLYRLPAILSDQHEKQENRIQWEQRHGQQLP